MLKNILRDLFREELDIRDKLLNLILLATFGGGSLFLIVSLLFGANQTVIYAIGFLLVAVVIALLVANRANQPQLAAIVLVMVANMGVFPMMYFMGGGIGSGIPVWQVFGLIFSWLLLKGPVSILVYILNVTVAVGCIVLEMLFPNLVQHQTDSEAVCLAMIQSIVVVTCILGIVFKYQIYVYEKKHVQLAKSDLEKTEINKRQEKLLHELQIQTQQAGQRREKLERLTGQMMLTLAETIDAKDRYTNGHSVRVAEYAREIARRAGKTPQYQQDIYFIGLLHDIGKIGIPNTIINKPSGLTEEEYQIMKDHTRIGAEILQNMTEIPELKVGAHWHHELYDGTGYPDGLKGNVIPETARIIGVADAYDAMTSKRSYRDILPQEVVREEFEKGLGTQFDPYFARIMLEMIEEDKEYRMHEGAENMLFPGKPPEK